MENSEIAHIFFDIADILEIKGENIFRVNAYRRAARTVSELPESLKEQHEEKELQKIPGIGKHLAENIVEMLEKGKLEWYDDLMKEPVAQVIELTRIPDIGPKKAKLFYERLGVMSVDDLEKAANKGQIQKLPGMGEKMEQKILRRIEKYHEHQQRSRLNEAYEFAAFILEELREQPMIKRAEFAGSLRRGRETVGDLDFLVIAPKTKSDDVLDFFVSLPIVTEILGKGDRKASVLIKSGIQCDLRVFTKDDFGAGMMYFTGSKEHNVMLRRIAISKGYKLNEYGLFKGDKEIQASKGASEEEIYAALGLQFVEPEMRENRGEIELAENKKLPNLITLKDLHGDLHNHTKETDGRNTLEEMAQAGIDLGYQYMAITDHSYSLRVTNGLDKKRALKEIKDIQKFNASQDKIHIFTGTEVDILEDGSLDHSDEVLSQMDIVVASVHSLFNLPEEEQTARVMKAIESPYITILGHPSGRLINQREPYAISMEKVIQHAAKHHVVLEINASPERLDLKDTHILYAKKKGAKFAISTDSHTTFQMMNMNYGVTTARRGWLEKKDVINTKTLKQLQTFLKKQREAKA